MSDLERETLVGSGLGGEERIRGYHVKLDFIFQEYLPRNHIDPPPLERARTLFDALWKKKSNRYSRQGPFRLNQIIDAELEHLNQPVGNCLGLTILYNCLLRRIGIWAQALYSENAFEVGPHVLTLIKVGEVAIDVENILPDGFDYKGHLESPCRAEWGDNELVADIYQSTGTQFFHAEKFQEALINYDLALTLYPGYEKAKINRAILLDRMGKKG